MRVDYPVTCPYCGAQKIVNVEEILIDDVAYMKKLAVAECNCEQASLRRGMERTSQSIDQLLGEGAKQRGYDYELHEDTIRAVVRVCEDMLQKCFDKVQFEEPNGDVIKLIVDGNRVKVTRTQKRQMTL